MQRRGWELRISDITEAIRRIQVYTSGHDQQSILANSLVRDVVLRNFTVIDEAASHMPDEGRLR